MSTGREDAVVMWFRRDLRLRDNPAVAHAGAGGRRVVPLFVLDDALCRPAGANRLAFLYRCLRSLDVTLGGHLVVRRGDPTEVVEALVAEAGAATVMCAADFGPYGRARDGKVAEQVDLDPVGSPYAVAPGRVLRGNGRRFETFSSYYRSWRSVDLVPPAPAPADVHWVGLSSEGVPPDPDTGAALPAAGEDAALAALARFRDDRLGDYGHSRDRPGEEGSSRLSPYLKYGCLHPRQVLDGLGVSASHERFRMEVAWRDFYADVLFHRPGSAREPLRPAGNFLVPDQGDDARDGFSAWTQGRTGYPLVDAGMRALLHEGWMHNRVRMVTASFLVKDLHLPWHQGARWFMRHLVDGDLASNSHGWQWVAGVGTDAAPFHRVFNPTLQAQRFDPDGTYIRRWVAELRDVPDEHIHEPWQQPAGPPAGYPPPIVDHHTERREALRRWAEATAAASEPPGL